MSYEKLAKLVEEYSSRKLPFNSLHIERRKYEALGDATLQSKSGDYDFLRGLINEITYQIALGVCLTYRGLPWSLFKSLAFPTPPRGSIVDRLQAVVGEQTENRQCVSYYVGVYKKEKNLPIEDVQRELKVKESFKETAIKLNCPTLLAEQLSEFAEPLIGISKDVQSSLDKITRPPKEISLGVFENNMAEPVRKLDELQLSGSIGEEKYERIVKHLIKVENKRLRRYIGVLMRGEEPYSLYFIKDPLQIIVSNQN